MNNDKKTSDDSTELPEMENAALKLQTNAIASAARWLGNITNDNFYSVFHTVRKWVFGFGIILISDVPVLIIDTIIAGLRGTGSVLARFSDVLLHAKDDVPRYFSRRQFEQRLRIACEQKEFLSDPRVKDLIRLWELQSVGDEAMATEQISKIRAACSDHVETLHILDKYTDKNCPCIYSTIHPICRDLWMTSTSAMKTRHSPDHNEHCDGGAQKH